MKQNNNGQTTQKDPRGPHEPRIAADGSGINSHVHRGIDEMVVPTDYPAGLTTFEWWSPNGTKNTVSINEEKLFTMTHLKGSQAAAACKLITIAQIRGDRVAYLFAVRRLLSTLGEEGRGRMSIKEIVMGASQKINESVQMHKERRIRTGSDGRVKEIETSDETDVGGGGE